MNIFKIHPFATCKVIYFSTFYGWVIYCMDMSYFIHSFIGSFCVIPTFWLLGIWWHIFTYKLLHEWKCLVIWQHYLITEEPSDYFQKWPHHLTSPPFHVSATILHTHYQCVSSHFSIFSPMFLTKGDLFACRHTHEWGGSISWWF